MFYKEEGFVRGMVVDWINGIDFFFVVNKYGNVIEIFKILDDGFLKCVVLIMDIDEIYLGIVIML